MQPRLTSSLRGPPVRIQIGTSSSSSRTAACRTKLMPVHRQNGDRADYLTQELDMETTSITTTSTELLTLDNKMIDLDQVACSIFPRDFMGSAGGSVLLDQPAGTSKTAIFDVQSEPSVDSGRGLLPFKHTEGLSLHPCVSNMVDSVPSSERPMLSKPPCVSSMVDSGLSPEVLPCVSGMVDSVLSSERPISPSDFLQKNPAPSSPQMQDLEIPSDLMDEIFQLFAETSESITLDCIQQLDLNLFSHCEERDTLDDIMQECGILDEIKEESHVQCKEDRLNFTVKEESHVHCKEDRPNFTVKEESHVHCKGDRPNFTVKEESHVHCKGDRPNFTVPTTMTQPPRNQSDCVGPVRTRQTRRNSRKPVRYRITKHLDDEPATTEVTVNTDLEDLVASTSSTTRTRRQENDWKELSNEEKYVRNREQNNLASKRSREKRKGNVKKMEMDLHEMERTNKDLQDKVAKLTLLRDDFKGFVNKFLFQRMAQK